MEAREYLKKVNRICDLENGREQCASEQCPLWNYSCGLANTEKEIEEVVKFVEKFDLKAMPWLCKVCGYNLDSEDLKNYVVNYCPICGTKTERAPDSVASTEQEQKAKLSLKL